MKRIIYILALFIGLATIKLNAQNSDPTGFFSVTVETSPDVMVSYVLNLSGDWNNLSGEYTIANADGTGQDVKVISNVVTNENEASITFTMDGKTFSGNFVFNNDGTAMLVLSDGLESREFRRW